MSERAPHILILSSWFPTKEKPFLGNFVERHAELLSRKYRVTVLTLECTSDFKNCQVSKRMNGNFFEVRGHYHGKSKIARFVNRNRAFSQALNLIEEVDLIIGHVLLPHGWMFPKAAKKKQCPWIWVEHGSYFRSDISKKWTLREKMLLRKAVNLSSEIVAVSETLKTDLERFTNSRKVRVIGNHVDGTLFSFEKKKPVDLTHFLHVSTLDANTKNPEGIFDACKLLKEERIKFQLTVISDENYNVWENYVKNAGIADCVQFLGPLNWNELPGFYHKADAFVLNSNYESFSIVVAEALSTGTPVIATDVGIVPEIGDEFKLSVTKGNPESLMEAMKTVALQQKAFQHEAIADYGKKFHADNILDQWSQLVESYAR